MRTGAGIAFVMAAVLLLGCQGPKAELTQGSSAEPKDPQTNILNARDDLFAALSFRLMEEMTSGGPAAAIEVCSVEAPRLAKQIGEKHSVSIGRTSFKLRNPDNKPPQWAAEMLEERPTEPVFVDLPDNQTGALLPIHLKSQCLMCHGPAEQISQDVMAQLNKFYPEDQATGFNEGDLRGWFWVVAEGHQVP